MSLTKPEQKMSKSDSNPKSRILITDSEEEISKKVRSALTDSTDGISYDPIARPGVSNLLDIMLHMSYPKYASVEDVLEDCRALSMRTFKERVSDAINTELEPVREQYREVF